MNILRSMVFTAAVLLCLSGCALICDRGCDRTEVRIRPSTISTTSSLELTATLNDTVFSYRDVKAYLDSLEISRGFSPAPPYPGPIVSCVLTNNSELALRIPMKGLGVRAYGEQHAYSELGIIVGNDTLVYNDLTMSSDRAIYRSIDEYFDVISPGKDVPILDSCGFISLLFNCIEPGENWIQVVYRNCRWTDSTEVTIWIGETRSDTLRFRLVE